MMMRLELAAVVVIVGVLGPFVAAIGGAWAAAREDALGGGAW